MVKHRKVFCIGYHKTGTSTLSKALRILGYSVTGPNGNRDPDIQNNLYSLVYALSYQYDAFQDNPWPLVYREMDRLHPGCKFILSVRDTNEWIESQVRYFGCKTTPMREMIYGRGCPAGNEELYIETYEQHNKNVKDYFKNRPNDLLVIDVTKNDAWDELCNFLDEPKPNTTFPHANSAKRGGSLPKRAYWHLAKQLKRKKHF